MNQRLEFLKDDDGNNLHSHYRISYDKHGNEISRVPVVDVRDGIAYRLMGMQMDKSAGRSKYMNYNQYHVSPKPKQYI